MRNLMIYQKKIGIMNFKEIYENNLKFGRIFFKHGRIDEFLRILQSDIQAEKDLQIYYNYQKKNQSISFDLRQYAAKRLKMCSERIKGNLMAISKIESSLN